MSVGNWRSHIIVKCVACRKPMGWHVETVTAKCNDCESKDTKMYNILFDGNCITVESLEAAQEIAGHLLESAYYSVEIVPSAPTDLDSLGEIEVDYDE
jgi:hypothetical protein